MKKLAPFLLLVALAAVAHVDAAADHRHSNKLSRTRGPLMAEHEPCIGQSDDWYTPREIFDALGLVFDVDPCSPGPDHWVPARLGMGETANTALRRSELGLFVVLPRPPCAGNASDGLGNGGGARAAVCAGMGIPDTNRLTEAF
jgi:hypothetical protein